MVMHKSRGVAMPRITCSETQNWGDGTLAKGGGGGGGGRWCLETLP